MAASDISTPDLEALFKKSKAAGDDKTAGTIAKEILRRRSSATPEDTGPGWGETLARGAINLPNSAFQNLVKQPIDFIKTAVTDPEQAAGAVFSPIAGAVRQIPGLEAAPENKLGKQSEEDFQKVKDFYVKRYGSLKGFKEAVGTDPFGIITDAATVVAPVARVTGLGARVPGLLTNAAKVLTNPVGEAAGAVVRHGAQIPRLFQGPTSRARGAIADIAEQHPTAAADMAELGPEAVLGDVLGAEGRRRGHAASNLSPQAADIIDTRMTNRHEGRAQRLLAAEEDTRAAHRPIINNAYRQAKAEGADLPKVQETVPDPRTATHGAGTFSDITRDTNIPRGFEDIINEPLLRPFWNRAERLVSQLENVEDQGDFARLDKFRSIMREAAGRTTDATHRLALQQGVDDIEAAMRQANISPGRTAARQAHQTMEANVEVANEIAARTERRFARTRQGMTGNSSTVEQATTLSNILNRGGIIGDFWRGNWLQGSAKIVSMLMGDGMGRANAQRLAEQMVEEARLLMGTQLPERPLTSRIGQGGRLLGDATAYGTLLGGKSQQLLGGPR